MSLLTATAAQFDGAAQRCARIYAEWLDKTLLEITTRLEGRIPSPQEIAQHGMQIFDAREPGTTTYQWRGQSVLKVHGFSTAGLRVSYLASAYDTIAEAPTQSPPRGL